MAAGAAVMLMCLQRKHMDSGVRTTRLQPRDPSFTHLGSCWPKIIGSNLIPQQFWPGHEILGGSAGRRLPFPLMRPRLQRAQWVKRGGDRD